MSLLDVQLHRVETAEDASACMRWLSENRRPVLACDTETTGLKWWTPQFTRLIQFGDTQEGWTIGREWFGLAREILTQYGGPFAFHNAKFDMHALEVAGMPLPKRHQMNDTYLMHCLLEPLAYHGLKNLAEKHIDASAGMGDKMLKRAMKEGGWYWDDIPEAVPAYGLYAAIDTVLTARLYEKFLPKIEPYSVAYERELAAQWILYGAERRGIRIDTDYTTRLRNDWVVELAQLKSQLQELGISNPNANRQIEDALVAAGWEPEDFTATGQAKLDKQTFATILSSAGLPEVSEAVRLLVEYKQKLKWKSAYLDTFLNESDVDGFVHPDIRTMQARTGRMSITRPALQTLPRDPAIRGCVLPHADDEVIYAVDYESQEARLMIHYSQEMALADVIATGQDLHCYIASNVYGEVITKSDPRRSLAKNTLYALMYGAGARKIAATSGAELHEVEKFIDGMNFNFPGIRRLMDNTDRQLKMALGGPAGRAELMTHGGRMFVSEPDKTYKGVNGLIQGTAADVVKEKLVQLDSAGLADTIIIPVHDEFLFSIPQGPDGLEMANKCKDIMEDHSFTVPLTCALSGPFENWGAHYE